MASNPSVRTGTTRLPVLHSVGVLVVGGSCAAVAAAVSCARLGRRVLPVESRTYLGR